MSSNIHIAVRKDAGPSYQICGEGVELSRELQFGSGDLELYGANAPTKVALEAGEFVADTKRGGSCNADVLTITPHCNGTHTETAGHIIDQPLNISGVLPPPLLFTEVVTVVPVDGSATKEELPTTAADTDRVITAEILKGLELDWSLADALVVRVKDFNLEKLIQQEPQSIPYFSYDALDYLNQMQLQHLIVELPSVDRLDDGGALGAHHSFWGVDKQSGEVAPDRADCTITELVRIPENISDGTGLVSLQFPSLASDAAPSRVVYFPLKEVSDG